MGNFHSRIRRRRKSPWNHWTWNQSLHCCT